MDPKIAYDQAIADDETQKKAANLYQSGQLQMQPFNTNGVISVQVWGQCPRCTHSIDVQETLTAPVITATGGWKGIGRFLGKNSVIPKYITVNCDCTEAHDGAPTGVAGCGVTFQLATAPPAASA